MPGIEFIDSHTAGEPTRVIVAGGPDLGSGPLAERVERFRSEFDRFRRMVILEPRGSEALVGALLCEPDDPGCQFGVIFFNNRGYLGMCGHGTIGLAATLAHLGRIEQGVFRLDTPVGPVEVDSSVGEQRVDPQRALLPVPSAGLVRCSRGRTAGGRHRLGRQLVLPRRGVTHPADRGPHPRAIARDPSRAGGAGRPRRDRRRRR